MTKKDYILLFTLFVFIFQPPFLPYSLIYLLGPIVLWALSRDRSYEKICIIQKSKIKKISVFFFQLTVYLFFINLLDILISEDKFLLATRLRCINQLLILSLFQFSFIVYLLLKFEERQFGLENVMDYLVKAGLVQGFCAVVAFLVPQVRQLFIMFGDQALFSNEFFMERRGFGFSMTLIDTFGYGMGLIAGYILLFNWSKEKNKKLLLSFLLISFAIAVNARTGILVILIAIAVKYLYCNSISTFFKRILPVFLVIYGVITYAPALLAAGARSENATISWICLSFSDIFELLQGSGKLDSAAELDFFSTFIGLPTNPFELLFGAGHYVYDTQDTLGFRTDIGYLNMFWEFGILGSAILLLFMLSLLLKPFYMTRDIAIKKISLFNTITYFALLMKAILIGYNPGVFINYLVTFSLYFYIWKEKQQSLSRQHH